MTTTDIVYFTVPSVELATAAVQFVGGAIVVGAVIGGVVWVGLRIWSAIWSIEGHRAERPAVEE